MLEAAQVRAMAPRARRTGRRCAHLNFIIDCEIATPRLTVSLSEIIDTESAFLPSLKMLAT